ncbi:hypothetical protein HY988_01365 [Candidatus Micrarchaeota archaeon]|nr:hypothetical protein [Candidatus Micrarchaeota archaeon]
MARNLTINDLMEAIEKFRGIPTVRSLAKILGCDHTLVSPLLKTPPYLQDKLNQKGLEYIDSLSTGELKKQTAKSGGLSVVCKDNKVLLARIHCRFDKEIIQPAIDNFKGIPTMESVAKAIRCGRLIIKSCFESNPSLQEKLTLKGLEYINDLSADKLKKQIAKRSSLTSICQNNKILLARLYARFDEEIINPAIDNFKGLPKSWSLAAAIGCSDYLVSSRLKTNPILFTALAKNQGITVDQALELALERKERTPAIRALFEQHLTDLWAFREMLAIARVFSDVFAQTRQVWEASLYPRPLARALAMEHCSLPMRYVDLNDFEPSTALKIGLGASAGVIAVVQSIHRLDEVRLNHLLEELHRVLPEDSHILLTYSIRHALLEGAVSILERKGLQLQEHGQIHVELPDDVFIDLPSDESARVRKKIEGSSQILHLVTLSNASPATLPSLVKLPTSGEIRPPTESSGDEIGIPKESFAKLHASFALMGLTQLPNEPFMVTVTGATGQPLAVLGFDMHPLRQKTVEARIYPDGRGTDIDFRAEAGKLARDASRRIALGVASGKETRIPLTRLMG